ncbi:gametogenetin-binding protein 1-like [Sciurus carolinensis]|uniref:gametogenetin-binding protein 1-like n=1 Tax=Sciurus carolinensis TaxID=30640 RepID=UPI001FB56DC3|nr:gametogenetin-binding protein 1-like [Sciurus carolinensis]
MEAPTRTPRSRSRILGRSSVFRFFRSLVGSKGSPKSSDKALARGQLCLLQEQDTTSLKTGLQGGSGWREPGPLASLPCTLSVAVPRGSSHLLRHEAFGLGMGDMGTQTTNPKGILRLTAQGVEVKSFLPRGSLEVPGNLSEKDENRNKEAESAGEASGNSEVLNRSHFAQALEVEQECLPKNTGLLEVSPEAFTREEEEEEACLLDGDLRLASSKAGTPWNRLLGLYKQLQKSTIAKVCGDLAHPQIPLKEGLPHEEKREEEEMEEEDSSFKLCVPSIVSFQSPLHKTFRSTDTVGFVESELKKLLAVQREARLWKMGSLEGRELLTQPEMTLEEAGMVDGQHLLLEEVDEMGNWPPPE